MKEFTQQMLNALYQADQSVRGTADYTKYLMEMSYKPNGKKNWKFLCWGIPSVPGHFKTFKEKTYIVTEFMGNTERHEVTEAVRELLNI